MHCVYTDGSCSNNQKPKIAIASSGWIITDGYFKDKTGGLHIDRIEMPFKDKNITKNVKFHPSNIRAEGFAILNVLKYIDEETEKNKLEYQDITINTDSQFWIDMMIKWVPIWVKKIESGKMEWTEKKNHDLVKDLWNTINFIKKKGKKRIIMRYVQAYHDYDEPTDEKLKDWTGNKKAEEIAKSYLRK